MCNQTSVVGMFCGINAKFNSIKKLEIRERETEMERTVIDVVLANWMTLKCVKLLTIVGNIQITVLCVWNKLETNVQC